MGAIDKALTDVTWEIPKELLRAAFLENDQAYWHGGIRRLAPINLNDAIRSKVIDARIRPDCDIVGGTEIILPLRGVDMQFPDNYTTIIRIPMSMTQHRNITTVLAVLYGWPDTYQTPGLLGGTDSFNNNIGGVCGTSTITNAAQQMLQSYAQQPQIQMTNVALEPNNVIVLFETQLITTQLTARVVVSNDYEFSNINIRSWDSFSQLVLYAVKAYIWKELKIKVDEGQLVGGVELGAFKEVMESYSDANENYKDFLRTKWSKVAAYNDPLKKHRAIRMGAPRRF